MLVLLVAGCTARQGAYPALPELVERVEDVGPDSAGRVFPGGGADLPDAAVFDVSNDDLGSDEFPEMDLEWPETDGNQEPDLPDCDCPPPTVAVTVNKIPATMNGSQPFTNLSGALEAFHLAVPSFGFVWNVTVDCPCGCADDALSAWAEALEASAPGPQLGHLFDADKGEFRYMLDEEHELDESELTNLHADVTDQCGQAGAAYLQVQVLQSTPELHPFDLVDPWLMVYKRDHQTIGWHLDEDSKGFVTADFVPNGIPDFLEDLWTFGLGTPTPTAAFQSVQLGGAADGNDSIARTLLGMTRQKAYVAYRCATDGSKDADSVNIRFYVEGEPQAPDASDFKYQFLSPDDNTKSFSMIGFGGGDLSKSLVGLSETVDEWNVQNENNAKIGYGCLTSSLSRYFYQYVYEDDALYALAATVLAEVLPAMGGTPLGEMEGDDLVIDLQIPAGQLPPHLASRRTVYTMMLDALSAGLGALMAHEIGHSLGLVAYGPPPYGLFGSEKNAIEFVVNPKGCAGAHLDTEGPNLMAAGPGSGNMSAFDISILFTPFFFNELNLAYLQGRVLLAP